MPARQRNTMGNLRNQFNPCNLWFKMALLEHYINIGQFCQDALERVCEQKKKARALLGAGFAGRRRDAMAQSLSAAFPERWRR